MKPAPMMPTRMGLPVLIASLQCCVDDDHVCASAEPISPGRLEHSRSCRLFVAIQVSGPSMRRFSSVLDVIEARKGAILV